MHNLKKQIILSAGLVLFVASLVTSSCGTSSASFVDTDFEVNGVKFRMIAVEGGSFMMGATPEQGDVARENEKPAHKVTVDDFYIGETEVTQRLWFAVMGYNPSQFQTDEGYRPVENVSWNDVHEFINGLNDITGMHFRLPIEAEWEYAARGGKKTTNKKYAGSDNLDEVAWSMENASFYPHSVAEKKPNELGIYDMSGNVWEWVEDKYQDYQVNNTDFVDSLETNKYVEKGGGWWSSVHTDSIDRYRPAFRDRDDMDYRSVNGGFRIAL